MPLRPVVIVHYHEISLKRGNRPLFLRHLARNLRSAIADLGPATVRQRPGRIVLDLDGHPQPEAVRERVQRVCGVASVSLGYRTSSTLSALQSLIRRRVQSVPYLPNPCQVTVRAPVERRTQGEYPSRLHLVPLGEIRREVVLSVPPPARVVVCRRLMIRIAEAIASASGALALATGES